VQELEVDGDLKVTGNIQAGTIDSLQQIIGELQLQGSAQAVLISQLQSQLLQIQQSLGLIDCNGVGGGGAIVDNCGVCEGDNSICEYVIDIDGNIYETVEISEQLWLAENLKVTHYNNGDEIPTGLTPGDNGSWYYSDQGGYAIYDNNPENADTYGLLYKWYSATDLRGLCPVGFHVPSEYEFNELITYLGGLNIAGGKLKETGYEHWESPNLGATNESGFTALPAGGHYGQFDIDSDINLIATFWSTEVHNAMSEQGVYMRLPHDGENTIISIEDMHRGFSIRCIQD